MSKLDQEIFKLSNDFQTKLGFRIRRASLGDINGRIDEPGQPGYVRVRFPVQGGFSEYLTVLNKAGTNKTPGTGVIVGLDIDSGEIAALRLDFQALLAQGTNPTSSNPADPNNSYFVVQQRLSTFNCHPVSSTANSMLVAVQTGDVIDLSTDTLTLFPGAQVDLTSLIPGGAGEWCLAVIFVKTDMTIETIASTPKTNPETLGIDDINECLAARTAGNLPIWAWQLYNGQTGIAAGAPANGGDDFMDLRPLFFMLQSSGGGGMTDFLVAGDSGTPQTITDGNTLSVLGGDGIDTAASATDTLTVAVDSTVVRLTGAQTLASKILSQLHLLIGGFKGIFTHANTADRTYTFKDANGTVAFTSDIPAAAITQLTGDVTAGPGSGSQAATVASVGGATAANVAKAVAALADKFILQQADATNLPNAQAMGALATGIVKNTTTTGVQSIAVAETDYVTPSGAGTLANKILSQLQLLIGGFKGIFTHANTADRTYTYPDVSFTVGRDSFIVAKNVTGGTINAGQLVYLSGASGVSNAQIAGLAIANSTIDKIARGMVKTASIANNAFGLVQIGGVFSGFSAASGYGIQYLSDSSAGSVTSTPPSAPSFVQIVGIESDSLGGGDFTLLFNAPNPATPTIADIQAFGDGSDGNVTVSAPLSLTRDMSYNNLTISSGAVITPAGYRIHVLGTLDISAAPAGWITVAGSNASGQTGGVTPASANIAGGGAGGNGGAVNTNGAVGGAADEGGIGGNGGRSGSTATAGGTVTPSGNIIKRWAVDLLKGIALLVGGAGGTGGTGGGVVGSGGGGGGGIVYIAANTIARGSSSQAGGIVASGGSASNPANTALANGAGAGGGGGGGWVYIVYKLLTGSAITNHITASGGTGGNGGNGATTGGTGGTGGGGGRVTKINIATGVITETAGSAGTAGSANTGGTGGAGGAGNTFQASL